MRVRGFVRANVPDAARCQSTLHRENNVGSALLVPVLTWGVYPNER